MSAQGKHLVLTCNACHTISTKDLNDVFFWPKMELSVLADLMHCPECDYCNAEDGEGKLAVSAE